MLTMTSTLTKKSIGKQDQLGLNCVREICIFMYKIASVRRGALSHIPLHKVFVFVWIKWTAEQKLCCVMYVDFGFYEQNFKQP